MRHPPTIRSSAFAALLVQGRATLWPGPLIRTVHTNGRSIARFPSPEPCESETENHSRMLGIRLPFCNAEWGPRRCAVTVVPWARAVAGSEQYLPYRVRPK